MKESWMCDVDEKSLPYGIIDIISEKFEGRSHNISGEENRWRKNWIAAWVRDYIDVEILSKIWDQPEFIPFLKSQEVEEYIKSRGIETNFCISLSGTIKGCLKASAIQLGIIIHLRILINRNGTFGFVYLHPQTKEEIYCEMESFSDLVRTMKSFYGKGSAIYI